MGNDWKENLKDSLEKYKTRRKKIKKLREWLNDLIKTKPSLPPKDKGK